MANERSAIERMIDAACGFVEAPPADGREADGDWLILRCPECSRIMASEREDYDPPTATLVEIQCECNGVDFTSPSYYDSAGREVHGEVADGR